MLQLRYILTTICLVLTSYFTATAQQNFKAIESEKIAYITKELKISPEEAEHFFPVYNQYNKEMWDLKKAKRGASRPLGTNSLNPQKRDVIAFDVKVVELKKSYRSEFAKILGNTRASQFFQVEEDFFNKLRSKLQNRRNKD